MLSLISRYFHTLRYLKPIQIYRRVWFHIVSPRIDERDAPALRSITENFCSPAQRQVSFLKQDFFFLNQSGSLTELDWDGDLSNSSGSISKLWRYNQHYFDDLNAFKSALRRDWHLSLLKRWVEENPSGVGVGWEPYPTSLRIVNWVKWHCNGNGLPQICLKSLAVQARWLSQRIEWHILGNHLFANAKALVFAGLFFSGKEANRWLRVGLKIIEDELCEQVLPDGGNFERSPMYHALFLEVLLDFINLSRAFPGEVSESHSNAWVKTAKHMLVWLEVMVHPDGEIAFFNDSAKGIAPSPEELFAYAHRLELNHAFQSFIRVTHLADSGYVRVNLNDAVALLDIAPIGPDYLPGHAHADTMSFELSLFGQRVFVNGGTSEYGTGEIRQYERSTAAHNTVEINGKNSSEVWGGFRVAQRAYPSNLKIKEHADSSIISCAHDGYRRLRGKPIHHRSWRFSDSSLTVEDCIEGSFDHAFAYFHLHPSLEVSSSICGGWLLHLRQGKKILVKFLEGKAQLVSSFFSPEFGKRLKTLCFRVELDSKAIRVQIDWSPND